MEDGEPNESSYHAAHGTAAHDLAARRLQDVVTNGSLARDIESYEDDLIEVEGRSFVVDEEMMEAVTAYVDKVMSCVKPGDEVLVEQRLYHGPYIGLSKEDAFGTGDAVSLLYSIDTIAVDDFKFGKGVRVFAEQNSQMKCYALGALHKYGLVHDFKTVRMAIHQPRIDHYDVWECSVEELERWAREEGSTIAADALDLLRLKRKGIDEYLLHLAPGEKQCHFCNATACPALAEDVARITGAADDSDFADESKIELKTNAQLAIGMEHVGLVEVWCKKIRAEIERRMFRGETVPGYKLGQGKQGPRKWVDKAAAEAKLKSYRLPIPEMYSMKVISPTQAEKVLAKTSPRRWADLQDNITRSPGKPSVMPIVDARPEVPTGAPHDDFEDETAAASFSPTGDHPFRS
jgi:hypothetical protein